MKKFLSFIAIFVISSTCFFSCGSTSNGNNKEEPTTINFTLDGYAIKYNGDCTGGIINIPSEINGETVEKIMDLDISYKNTEERSKKRDLITKIVIPETVKDFSSIGFSQFTKLRECEVAEENPVYCSIDGVVYSKDKTRLCYVPPKKWDYTIPDYVTEIGDFAFNDWNSSELYIPSTVKKIGCISSNNLTITLDDSFKNDTELINSLVCKDDYNEIKVICGGEEYAPDIEAYNEKKLDELRNKTFSGNRTLWKLSSLDYSNEEYKDATNSGIEVNSVSAKIEGKELVLTISVKSKVEYSADCIVSIGYYNAAGELKGSADCDMGIIPGLGSDEATFRGEPNCINYLYYYKVKSVVQSTRR